MSENLHTLINIPAQAIAVDKIIHYTHGDVSVISHPRGNNEEYAEQENKNSDYTAKIYFHKQW